MFLKCKCYPYREKLECFFSFESKLDNSQDNDNK